MNKTQLINTVARRTGMKKTQITPVINAAIEAIKDVLEKGEKAAITGFGTFALVQRAAKEGRNPQTGKPMKIPARKVVRFKAGKELKEIGK
jgi:DNA-binding protein HU-beta